MGLGTDLARVGLGFDANSIRVGLGLGAHALSELGGLGAGFGGDLRCGLLRRLNDRRHALARLPGDGIVATCDELLDLLLEPAYLAGEALELVSDAHGHMLGVARHDARRAGDGLFGGLLLGRHFVALLHLILLLVFSAAAAP